MIQRLILFICLILIAGCASSGLVIGPASYLTDECNKSDRLERSVKESKEIPNNKKVRILKAYNMGATEDEIAVGLGVDMVEMCSSKYTSKEKMKMLGANVVDGSLWYVVVNALVKSIFEEEDKTVYRYNYYYLGDRK